MPFPSTTLHKTRDTLIPGHLREWLICGAVVIVLLFPNGLMKAQSNVLRENISLSLWENTVRVSTTLRRNKPYDHLVGVLFTLPKMSLKGHDFILQDF